MLKKRAYLQINNLNDALAVELFSKEYPQLGGYFVEETEYPWNLWLSLSAQIHNEEQLLKSLPWKLGSPQVKTRKVAWADLLKKIVLERDRGRKIAERIIIKTSSAEVFHHVIHKHFQLQQGQIFFVSPQEEKGFYLLKITQPSLWCIHLAESVGSFEVYNESDDVEQLYIERGWKQRRAIHSTTLNLHGNLTILLGEDSFDTYNVQWRSANNIIDVRKMRLRELVADTSQRIVVPLRLVNRGRTSTSTSLWKVEDHSKLIKVISQVHYNQLAGFRAWFDDNGLIFIMSEGRLADSILKSQLANVFRGYIKYERYVFFPNGKELMPSLPEKNLMDMYGVRGDYLCFDEDGEMHAWHLKTSELRELSFFLQYAAQTAIRTIKNFANNWELNFHDVTPNPVVVIKDSGGKRSIEIKEDVARSAKKSAKRSAKKKVTSEETRLEYVLKMKEIDSALVEDVANADLWRQRSEVSSHLGNARCAVVSFLTSCIITNNHSAFLRYLQEHCSDKNIEISELFTHDSADGKLLAKIRDHKMYSAELNYALQLCFAHRFNDEDVRNNAISAMRIGYAGTDYRFHIFDDFDKSVEKMTQTSHIEEDELNAIKKKAEEFLSVLKVAKEEQRVVIRRQFALILENNFAKPILDESEEGNATSWLDEWKEVLQYLQNYRGIDIDSLEDCYKHWLAKLSLRDLKNTSFEKIFTGEVYRPIFNFNFKDEAMKEIENIYIGYASGGVDWKERFAYKYTAFDNAKNQRKLLYLITEYGPLPDFEQCIYDFKFGDLHFNTIIMNCDIYRLHLMYNKKMNEREFFDEMLGILPLPNSGYSLIDFCDGMENVILCLFLSSYQKREDIFIEAFEKILKWIDFYPSYLTELLTLVAFLQVGIVYHKLPDSVCAYNFYARKKSLWMNHANYISQNGWTT